LGEFIFFDKCRTLGSAFVGPLLGMTTEQIALAQVEEQLRRRGSIPTCMARNCPNGDIHARKGQRIVRFEVKALEQRNGVWLTKRQVNAVHIIVIYVVKDDSVWVLSPAEAHSLLDEYQIDFISRNGRPPAQEGFNKSQFPKPTGRGPLDRLL
jgi:hypothetical protein